MSADQYPPEVQAVLDAADEWRRHMDGNRIGNTISNLIEAVDAYRKSIAPPEPFEVWAGRYDGEFKWIEPNDDAIGGYRADQVWRCTVTPVERVK